MGYFSRALLVYSCEAPKIERVKGPKGWASAWGIGLPWVPKTLYQYGAWDTVRWTASTVHGPRIPDRPHHLAFEFGEQTLAVLLALALTDMNEHASAIDLFDFQLD